MKGIKKAEMQFIVGASSCRCEAFLNGTNTTFMAIGTVTYVRECGLICREIKDTLKPGEVSDAFTRITEALVKGVKSLYDLFQVNEVRDRNDFIDNMRERERERERLERERH